MKSPRLLYLTAHGMRAYRRQAGQLTLEEEFPPEVSGHRQFGTYLARHPDSPFMLLANLAEESFLEETIPLLRSRERQAVIQRRSRQHFHHARLTASLSLGIEKSRRHDERILLAALTGKESLLPWLDVIGHANTLLQGIHSLPLASAVLLDKLRLPDKNLLLVTIQDQSLRQSHFVRGALRFSRLTPLPDGSAAGIAQALSIETQKLQRYLVSHHQAENNEPLNAYLPAHQDVARQIRENSPDSPGVRYHILDIGTCARKAGLKTRLPDSDSEQLLLELLARKPPPVQFADDDLRRPYRIRQVRRQLLGIGASVLLLSLIYAGFRFHETYVINKNTELLRSETRQFGQRHDEIAKTLPALPVDYETLSNSIASYQAVASDNATPDHFYRQLSHALQRIPAIELDAIDWQRAPDRMAPPGKTGIHAAESAVIRGKLKTDPQTTPDEMQSEFHRLTEALAAQPGLHVAVEQSPTIVEAPQSHQSIDEANGKPAAGTFVLKITRSPGP